MNAVRFIDTNIILYAYDLNSPAKRQIAQDLVAEGWKSPRSCAVSVQVLQELHVNLCRLGVSRQEAGRIIQDFASWPVVDNTLELFNLGLNEQTRWNLSLWDAMILAAARTSGATELITEDFNHTQDYGGVRAVNPFK